MNRIALMLGAVLALDMLFGSRLLFAQRDGMPAGYPQSLEPALQALLARVGEGRPSAAILVQVSSTYFDIADDLLTEQAQRVAAYQAGAKAATVVVDSVSECDEINGLPTA